MAIRVQFRSAAFSTILSGFRQPRRQDASEVCTRNSRNQGIGSGYSPVWSWKPQCAATGSLGKSAGAYSAPIGAQVFTIERRNHSKTGVYEDLCMRVSVDTTCAVDKLKKAKKGFKFERFDVFFQLIRSPWAQPGSKGRIGRGAARMGGLPFDSASSDRSLQSRQRTVQNASGPASFALDMPSISRFRNPQMSFQPNGMKALFRYLPCVLDVCFSLVVRNSQSCERTGSTLPRSEMTNSNALFESGKRTRTVVMPAFEPIARGTAFAVWAG
jgi:hypothetical protein